MGKLCGLAKPRAGKGARSYRLHRLHASKHLCRTVARVELQRLCGSIGSYGANCAPSNRNDPSGRAPTQDARPGTAARPTAAAPPDGGGSFSTRRSCDHADYFHPQATTGRRQRGAHVARARRPGRRAVCTLRGGARPVPAGAIPLRARRRAVWRLRAAAADPVRRPRRVPGVCRGAARTARLPTRLSDAGPRLSAKSRRNGALCRAPCGDGLPGSHDPHADRRARRQRGPGRFAPADAAG